MIMDTLIISAAGCFFLGLLTTLHPCPLTTNAAALTFLSGMTTGKRKSWYPLILFIIGYVMVYIGISILLSAGLLVRSDISIMLQNTVRMFLGPVLIIVGMVLTDLIRIRRSYSKIFRIIREKQKHTGYALPLGSLLALSFCPATAAIFFGILIPITIRHDQVILFPVLYGMGATLPLVGITLFLEKGSEKMLHPKWRGRIPQIAGWIMILLGLFMSIQQLFL